MKTTPKYEKCRRWLMKGNKLTGHIAYTRFYLYSLRIFIEREREREKAKGNDIINLNAYTGKHGIYIHSDFIDKYQDEYDSMLFRSELTSLLKSNNKS